MVYYFSGTGNAAWVAGRLAALLEEPTQDILSLMSDPAVTPIVDLEGAKRLVLVFPVHAWGPAEYMRRFLRRALFEGYEGQQVAAVCVCGDDCGRTDALVRRLLARKGVTLSACYSVQMPNNYILLPGFDVDGKVLEKEKLARSEEAVRHVAEALAGHGSSTYTAGSFPGLKSAMVYPLFRLSLRGHNYFRVTDRCVSCGLCARVCPTNIIEIGEDRRPHWDEHGCVQCLACIHRCPVRAIEYGTISIKKGRYHHPSL